MLVVISVIVIVIPTLLVRGCTIGDSELKNPRGSVIKVFNHHAQQVQDMDLEEYIKGVVAAEMPASFEMEALKAQAVLARTYVLRRVLKGQKLDTHPQAVISTDPQNAQAWSSKEDLQEKWGLVNYLFNWNKISRAVEATAGQVLTYNNELIEALYHANAGGMTEDAANVWGNSVPYLKSVISEYDTEDKKYRQEFKFTWVELDQRLGTNLQNMIKQAPADNEITMAETDEGLIEILEFSSTGRILQLRIDGCIFAGTDLRTRLGLPSTKLEITATTGGVEFVSFGNGHGVGMSQYGANGMAQQGKSYSDILLYYYSGVKVSRITRIQN